MQDLFGTSVLDHTIVVFTRADPKFNLRKYINTLFLDHPPLSSGEVAPGPPSHHPRRAQQYALHYPRSTVNPRSAVYQFLQDDINKRYMAVDNQCESKYQKAKTRDALIELIDVVQTFNKGRPFSDKYFDKAKQKLVQRREEEKEARKSFWQWNMTSGAKP